MLLVSGRQMRHASLPELSLRQAGRASPKESYGQHDNSQIKKQNYPDANCLPKLIEVPFQGVLRTA